MWEPNSTRRRDRKEFNAERGEQEGDTGDSYMVLFNYGSVVFVHFTEEQREVTVSSRGQCRKSLKQ